MPKIEQLLLCMPVVKWVESHDWALAQVQDGEEAGRALATGDQVEFSVLLNRKLGTALAEEVRLLCKAEDKRKLGQVRHCTCSAGQAEASARAAVSGICDQVELLVLFKCTLGAAPA